MTALGDNPIHCLNRILEVDPTGISLPEAMVESVAHWQWIAGAFEALELDSGPYESLARAELLDLASPVNGEGLTLRLELDQQARRCFYVVPQVIGADVSFPVPQVCPKCGNRLVEHEAGRFFRLMCDEDSLAWVNPYRRGTPDSGWMAHVHLRESDFCVKSATTPRSLSAVQEQVRDQKRHGGDQEEHGEHHPYGKLAPAPPTKTARKLSEALDCPGRAEGIQLWVRHRQSLLRGCASNRCHVATTLLTVERVNESPNTGSVGYCGAPDRKD